jgi:hypothetical protein
LLCHRVVARGRIELPTPRFSVASRKSVIGRVRPFVQLRAPRITPTFLPVLSVSVVTRMVTQRRNFFDADRVQIKWRV